jgi:acetylornithine deacetylase
MSSPQMTHPIIPVLTSLMSIPSTSNHESEIGLFLSTHLESLGYTVRRIPIAPSSPRHNIYAYIGSTRSTRVLLTAHMDTVPPHIPLRIEGNTIYGRGACDDLGPLVAQIHAAHELRAEGKVGEGDVGLLFVVGEENGGAGMCAVNEMDNRWEAGIFAEPTESTLAKGHKGQVAFEVVVTGKAWYVFPPPFTHSDAETYAQSFWISASRQKRDGDADRSAERIGGGDVACFRTPGLVDV